MLITSILMGISFYLLLLTMLSIDSHLVYGFSTYSCRDVAEGPSVVQCLQECTNMTQGKQISVNIYKQVFESNFSVFSCQRIKIIQEFTETWTFSRVEGTKMTLISPGSDSECREIIKKECTSSACFSYGPQLVPEYRYAQTVTKEVSYLAITSFNTTGFKSSKEHSGSLIINGKRVDASSMSVTDSNSRYLWNNPVISETCLWDEPLTTISCFESTDQVVCPRAGIVLTNSVSLKSTCKQMIMMDSSGIVFSVGNNPPNEYYPAILQTVEIGLKTAIEATRYSFLIRDQHKCQQDCLAIGISAIRVGGKYMIKNGDRWKSCDIISNCTIDRSTMICGNGTIVVTTCNGARRVLSLLTPFQHDQLVCTPGEARQYGKEEVFSLLSKYHSNHKEFVLLRSDEIQEITLGYNEKTLGGIGFLEKGSNSSSYSGHFITSVAMKIGEIWGWFGELTHRIKVIALGLICAIILFAIVSITIKIERRRHGSPVKVIYSAIRPNPGSEELIIQ